MHRLTLWLSLAIAVFLPAGLVAQVVITSEESDRRMPRMCVFPEPSITLDELAPYNPAPPLRFAERMPEFKGDIRRYLADNLHYPDSSRARGEEGRIVVQFIVDTTGCIRDPKIIRRSDYALLDIAALYVFQPMMREPYWKPGAYQGRLVEVYYNMPVTFRLD